jgi:hypothetical protein
MVGGLFVSSQKSVLLPQNVSRGFVERIRRGRLYSASLDPNQCVCMSALDVKDVLHYAQEEEEELAIVL